MMRWVWPIICAALGLVLFMCGWLIPAHVRAVDAHVLKRAGRNFPTLAQAGLALVEAKRLGAAELLLAAATAEGLADRQPLAVAVGNFAQQQPGALMWGVSQPRWAVGLGTNSVGQDSVAVPFTELVVRTEYREPVLELLQNSPRSPVPELLRLRALTNTVLFAPSQSASGQALDAAVAICGLLLEGGHLSPHFQAVLAGLLAEANRGGHSQPIEQALLDLMSLGQRFNWGQLVAFTERIEEVETLRRLAQEVRQAGDRTPQLFSAVVLSGAPAKVAHYLQSFSQTGLADLSGSLRYGTGGLNELLDRRQRLYAPGFRQTVVGYDPFGTFYVFMLDYCWLMPWFALAFKWLLYMSAGCLFAATVHLARSGPPNWKHLPPVHGFPLAREFLFALGFLLAILLLSEPFLSQESQPAAAPFRLRLPLAGSLAPAGIVRANTPFMNQLSLLALLLFFVLQALIYTACLIKLAEIRRQPLSPRMKLKLLENEDHLFDAGLYLGFVGTIISLILVSLGVIKPSLMAAYSSTSFGIIFVAIFKIFQLRPLRRKLLLQAEDPAEPAEPPSSPVRRKPLPQPTEAPAGPARRKPLPQPAGTREGEVPANPFSASDAVLPP